MPKSIKRAPTYHARLFEEKDKALDWVERMSRKMGDAYEFEVKFNNDYDLYHARMWDRSDAKRGKNGQVYYDE